MVECRGPQPCLAHTPLSPFVAISFPLLSKAVFRCILNNMQILLKIVLFLQKLLHIHLLLDMDYFYNGVLEIKCKLKILKDI